MIKIDHDDAHGPNKENLVARSGKKDGSHAAGDDDADFEVLFPPLRAHITALRSPPPPSPSLPKAPVFPSRFLTSPSASAALSISVPKSAAKSMPPNPSVPLPSFDLDAFDEGAVTPKPTAVPSKSFTTDEKKERGEVAIETKQQPLSSSEHPILTLSPSLFPQSTPPKPSAIKSFPPKPPVPLPSFDLAMLDGDVEEIAPAPTASKYFPPKSGEKPAPPSALPVPKLPQSPSSSLLKPFLSKPIADAVKAATLTSATAFPAKSLPPKPAVPLPSFRLNPFDDGGSEVDGNALPRKRHSTPPPHSLLLPEPAARDVAGSNDVTMAQAEPLCTNKAAVPVTPLAQGAQRRLGISSLLKGTNAGTNNAAAPATASISSVIAPSLAKPVPVTPVNHLRVEFTPPPSISPPPVASHTRHYAAPPSQLDSKVSCPMCAALFPTEDAVSRHIDDEHGDEGESSTNKKKQRKEREEGSISISSKSESKEDEDEDEDDFDLKRKKPIAPKVAPQSKHRRLCKGADSKRRNRSNAFIDDEAEVSGEGEEVRCPHDHLVSPH